MQFRRTSGRDSAQVVTPFVQVGTSPSSLVPKGADYAFTSTRLRVIGSDFRRRVAHRSSAVQRTRDAQREISRSFFEGPRIASTIDLSSRQFGADSTTGSKPRLAAQSLRGHTSCEAVGFPRHYPLTIASSLHETVSLGSAVMSGLSLRVASEQGK